MAKYNWMDISRNDVIKAIDIFLKENSEYPAPRSTFLIYEGKKLPAKHIRGMAYKVAYGKEISKSEFGGGLETVRFFERLGFDVAYNGTSVNKDKTMKEAGTRKEHVELNEPEEILNTEKEINDKLKQISSNKKKFKISSKRVIEQKNALQLLLNSLFDGDVVCEKTFSWLKTPSEMSGKYEKLYHALYTYRGDTSFAKKNVQLRCDFVCESKKIIIEYDERQHFTEARRLSLQAYCDIPLGYDYKTWMKACEDIQAKDSQPFNRDEIRAYYDSVRDIEAEKNGYRLIRIMHGQIDFEAEGALLELKKIIAEDPFAEIGSQKERPLRIGLYIQTEELKNKKSYDKVMRKLQKEDFDLLVFPEFSYIPFVEKIWESDVMSEDDVNRIYDYCLELSRKIHKAVIINNEDKFGTIVSFYANSFADDTETEAALYIKHTMTAYSSFDFENYQNVEEYLFQPILLKGYRIGMTICYDCNHPLFSRAYGSKGIDIIVNSTGGDVVYDKWYKYNQARAIENNCFTFVTMGGDGNKENPHTYVYGFDAEGSEMLPLNLTEYGGKLNCPGGVYIYDIGSTDKKTSIDKSLNQKYSENKKYDIEVPVNGTGVFLEKSKKIKENIYLYKYGKENIVFCIVNGEDISQAEKVLKLLYAEELKEYSNRRYIIVNRFSHISKDLYERKLSILWKVRSMENFCAVIVEADNFNQCYQCGKNRTAQVLKATDGKFRIDLERTSGPEAIWKNKQGMKASWREGYEWLLKKILEDKLS